MKVTRIPDEPPVDSQHITHPAHDYFIIVKTILLSNSSVSFCGFFFCQVIPHNNNFSGL